MYYCKHLFIFHKDTSTVLAFQFCLLIDRACFSPTSSLALYSSTPSLAGTQQEQHLHLQQQCRSAAAAPTAGNASRAAAHAPCFLQHKP